MSIGRNKRWKRRKQIKKINRSKRMEFLCKNKALINFVRIWRIQKFNRCVDRCEEIVQVPHVHDWNQLPNLQRWSHGCPRWCCPYYVDITLPKKQLIRVLIKRRLADLGYHGTLAQAFDVHRRIMATYKIQKVWRRWKTRWLYNMAEMKLPVTTSRTIVDTDGTKWYSQSHDGPYLPVITPDGIKLQVRAPFNKFVVKWTNWSLVPTILKPYTKLYHTNPVEERLIAVKRIQTIWIKYKFDGLRKATRRIQQWWRKKRFFYRTIRRIQKNFHYKCIKNGCRFQITLDGQRNIYQYDNYRVLNYWNNPVNWTLDIDRMVIRRYIKKTLQVIPYHHWKCRVVLKNKI
jgi:hypothetical protein